MIPRRFSAGRVQKGLSYGQLSVLLLTYIITQSDHRLSAVEPWVQTHRTILELTTGWSIGEKDTTDDALSPKKSGSLITTSTRLRRQINHTFA